MTTTQELNNYYANLLILQYAAKTKNYAAIQTFTAPILMPQATVQVVTFSDVPTAGVFSFDYGDNTSTLLNYNDATSVIETVLRGVTGLSGLTVTGSIAAKTLTVTFIGAFPPAKAFVVDANTLVASATPVTLTVTETDLTLPLAVQGAFDLTGDNLAVGAQLDILGKYVGASRTGAGFTGPLTLDDTDFYGLIQFAIIRNNAGSSLAEIVALFFQFFGANATVVDYTDMLMSFNFSSAVGSLDLVELVITEGFLPKPMAVADFVTYFDATNAFGFEGSVNSGGFGDATDASIGGEFASLVGP